MTTLLLLLLHAHPAPSFQGLEPCILPGAPPPVECGTLEVPEDRSREGGRTLSLRIVRLGATNPDGPDTKAPEALFVLLGGPGEAAAGAAPGIAQQFRALRVARDIVLVDQRGTGASNGLDCSLYDGDMDRAFGPLLPEEAVRSCAEALSSRMDLRHYTTADHADDLDAVREALGYERVDLYGVSYGTRAALVYIRRHESRVRSAVLHGLYPPGVRGLPDFAPDAQAALEGVLSECLAEVACAGAFPRIREEARQVMERLRDSPVPVRVLHPVTGEAEEPLLNATVAGEAIRYMLYRPAWAGLVPVILHQAHRGDLAGLAEFAVFARLMMIEGPGNGLWVAITCQEEGEGLDAEEADRRARGTLFDAHRARSFTRACPLWPHVPVSSDFHAPVRSDLPILILSGQWDPATPAARGDRALAHLTGALHLVVPSAGHAFQGLEGSECVDALVVAFVEEGAHRGLDVGCVREIRRPAFRTDPLPVAPGALDPDRVRGLAGRYGGGEAPLEIQVVPEGDRLRVTLPDGNALLVVPVEGGDLRFRPLGLPGYYLVFLEEDGSVREVRLQEPGSPDLVLPRR
jgi:pimeloyl-ACP methyl ester carboxylesterase